MRFRSLLFVVVALLAGGPLCAGAAEDGQAVSMVTADGKTITGKLYGRSATGLILCHGRAYLTGAASFAEECRHFQAKGLMCLALNFRGYPAKAPPDLPGQEHDVVAAFDYLAKQGAEKIYVLGSSMGGLAALEALKALSAKPQFAGIIILSAFNSQAVQGVSAPKLVIVAYDDRRIYTKVMAMFIVASSPKQAVVFEKGGHGQQLFKTHRQELLDLIALFTAAPASEATRGK